MTQGARRNGLVIELVRAIGQEEGAKPFSSLCRSPADSGKAGTVREAIGEPCPPALSRVVPQQDQPR